MKRGRAATRCAARRTSARVAMLLIVSAAVGLPHPVRADDELCTADGGAQVTDEDTMREAVANFLAEESECRRIDITQSFSIAAVIAIFNGDEFAPEAVDKSLTIDGHGNVVAGGGSSGALIVFLDPAGTNTLSIHNLGLNNFGGSGALTMVAPSDSSRSAALVVERSRFANNSHDGSPLTGVSPEATAGAINTQGTLSIRNSEFVDNAGFTGGAVSNAFAAPTTISGSTFARNSARSAGGAVYVTGDLTLLNSTITDNTAGLHAALSVQGDGSVDFSTIVDNIGDNGAAVSAPNGSLSIRRSIVYGNSTTDVAAGVNLDIANSLLTFEESALVDFRPAMVDGSGPNLFDVDPRLEILGDHGGFILPGGTVIQTRPPRRNSPVIDMISPSDVSDVTVDQRGSRFPRVVTFRADMGATEYHPANRQPDNPWADVLDSNESELPATQ